MNQRAFLMRLARPPASSIPHLLLGGLERVRAEFSLSALAYNIKRVINIMGVGPLLEHLQKRSKARKAPSFQAAGGSAALFSSFARWSPGIATRIQHCCGRWQRSLPPGRRVFTQSQSLGTRATRAMSSLLHDSIIPPPALHLRTPVFIKSQRAVDARAPGADGGGALDARG